MKGLGPLLEAAAQRTYARRLFITSANENLRGEVRRACERGRLWTTTALSCTHLSGTWERLTASQCHQTNDDFPFKKRRAPTCSVSVLFSVPGSQRLGPHTSRPIRCWASCCLPLLFSPPFMFAYPLSFTYSYLRFGRSFFASWYLSIWAWPQRASLSSEVGARNSLENRSLN